MKKDVDGYAMVGRREVKREMDVVVVKRRKRDEKLAATESSTHPHGPTWWNVSGCAVNCLTTPRAATVKPDEKDEEHVKVVLPFLACI